MISFGYEYNLARKSLRYFSYFILRFANKTEGSKTESKSTKCVVFGPKKFDSIAAMQVGIFVFFQNTLLLKNTGIEIKYTR